MRKLGIIVYLILSVVMGVLCFYSFMFTIFNLGDSLVSTDNKPLALTITITTIIVVSLFLKIGKRIFKSKDVNTLAIVIIIIAAIFTFPTTEALDEMKENRKVNYASSHESEMVKQVNQIITKSKLPFTLDLKRSNYDTIYYNDCLRINFYKNNEEDLTLEEFDQLITLLPTSKTGYYIGISYGKFNEEYKTWENDIGISLDENKRNANAIGGDFTLESAIEERYSK